MTLQNERANAIDAYIDEHPNALVGTRPLVLSGENRPIEAYRLPISLLCYNIDNGRFALEKAELEAELERRLDSTVPEDATLIKQVLLDLQPEKTEVLQLDLKQYGQLETGVITYDGFVINGNRRMAIFEELQREEGTGRWEYLEVMRLPPGVSARDLWRLEAGLQLSQEKRAEYGPVNELLKIRQGQAAGLSSHEIATSMYGWTEDNVNDAVERLGLIDEFLEWCGQPENYPMIKKLGLHEYFINIQTHVIRPAQKEELKVRQIARRKEQAFALMWSTVRLRNDPNSDYSGRMSHFVIRDLKKVYASLDAKEEYENVFVKQKRKKKEAWQIDPLIVRTAYDDAMEVVENQEMQAKPMKLADRAIKALEALVKVDPEGELNNADALRKAFDRLDTLVSDLREKYGFGADPEGSA